MLKESIALCARHSLKLFPRTPKGQKDGILYTQYLLLQCTSEKMSEAQFNTFLDSLKTRSSTYNDKAKTTLGNLINTLSTIRNAYYTANTNGEIDQAREIVREVIFCIKKLDKKKEETEKQPEVFQKPSLTMSRRIEEAKDQSGADCLTTATLLGKRPLSVDSLAENRKAAKRVIFLGAEANRSSLDAHDQKSVENQQTSHAKGPISS